MNIDRQAIENANILEASLHGIMTVPETYTYYSIATAVYSKLQSICKDSGIMIDVKIQLQMTIVFPAQLYAAETWTANKEVEKKTTCISDEVTQMYFGSEMARSKN